jgi:excisionase family DNA binding protein
MPTLRVPPPQKVVTADQVIPLAYKLADVGRILGGMHQRTIERLIARGELESVGRGKLRRVTYTSILAYLERNRNEVP